MILPEEIIDNIKYYTTKSFRCSPYEYSNVIKNPNKNYKVVTIYFNQWWKRKLVLKFIDNIKYTKREDGSNWLSIDENVEYTELVNQLKTHIAADNGYSVDQPKITLNGNIETEEVSSNKVYIILREEQDGRPTLFKIFKNRENAQTWIDNQNDIKKSFERYYIGEYNLL